MEKLKRQRERKRERDKIETSSALLPPHHKVKPLVTTQALNVIFYILK